jgi:hypothetical protein
MRDFRAAMVVCWGVRMSRCRSGREVLKRIVRWSGGGWKEGERRGEDGREKDWPLGGTRRFVGRGLVGEVEEEEDILLLLWGLRLEGRHCWSLVMVTTEVGAVDLDKAGLASGNKVGLCPWI